MDIEKIEVFGNNIDIRYADGSREKIENGIYELRDSEGKRIERHPATDEEFARLAQTAEDWESAVKPLDAVVVEVQVHAVDHIDVYYDDGRKESIELGRYEIKDADNNTIFERAVTPDDYARILDLDPGEFGTGLPADTGPIAIEGTDGPDDLEGTSADDLMTGLGGNDEIRGRKGNDQIDGDDGNDELRGDKGSDTVDGGAGNDTVRGDGGADFVSGGDGDDRVRGGKGKDEVSGGDGDDRVDGQNGNDILNGNAGSDIYNGGAGADTFVFEADGVRDTIKDFQDGLDLIDISAFGLSEAADLSMTQISVDRVMIDLGGGDEIEVHNATVEQLTDADFLF